MVDLVSEFSGRSVSRETLDRLQRYADELAAWNPKINLVSPSTISQLWERHLLDSLQLVSHIGNEPQRIADIGSGGGLPVIPLAILLPERKFYAVEIDQRKCAFLLHVKALTGLDNLTVRTSRIEEIQDVVADVITARACADINKLIAYSHSLRHKDSRCLFLKGRNFQTEIDAASEQWDFSFQLFPSRTEEGACIVELSNLKKK